MTPGVPFRGADRANAVLQALLAAIVLGLAAAPLWGSANALRLLGEFWIYLVLATLWNLLAGFGGLISVGQQAFVGLGGYALLAMVLLGVPPLAAIGLVVVFGAVAAVPIGAIAFRLRGAYFAIGTWAISEVLRLVAMRISVLGGGSGTSLPLPVLRALSPDRFVRGQIVYAVSFVLGLGCVLFAWLMLRSKWGLALRSIRDSEVGATSLGIEVLTIKFALYCVVGGLTAGAGAVVLLQKLRISPDAAFSVNDWTAFVIFIVVIGGVGTIEGPLVGTVLFFVLREALADYGVAYLVLLGTLAVLAMLRAPGGLWGAAQARLGFAPLSVRRWPPAHPGPDPTAAPGVTVRRV